jgi:hypothetical protein
MNVIFLRNTILKVLTTISHQFPSEEEAVLPEFHDNHIIWCCWDNDFLLHDISWYAPYSPEKICSSLREKM